MALIRTCDLCKEHLQTEWYQVTVTGFYGNRTSKQNTYDLCDICYKMLEQVAIEEAAPFRKEENKA